MFENYEIVCISRYDKMGNYIQLREKTTKKQIRMHYARYLIQITSNEQLSRSDVVIHLDGNPFNDNLDNLQVITQKELRSNEDYKIKIKCPKCGCEVYKLVYDKHYESCDGNNYLESFWEQFKTKDGLYKCPNCNKICKTTRSISQHYAVCMKGKTNIFKGQTKETNEIILSTAQKVKEWYTTDEHKRAHSNSIIQGINKDRESFIESCRAGGLKSSSNLNRRSKNEILFAEFLKRIISPEEIYFNENMFNGFDADIIIPSIKLAILWNGIWHLKKSYKNT